MYILRTKTNASVFSYDTIVFHIVQKDSNDEKTTTTIQETLRLEG